MSPVPGACYLLAHGVPDRHYFFILSDPARYPARPLVLAPMTSVTPEKSVDGSCLVGPGDHPCCVKPSFIFYRGALLLDAGKLADLVAKGEALEKEPATAALLRRLREGAERSDELPGKYREELWEQGVVEDRI